MLVVVGVLAALTIGGSVAAAWETVLLWANRVPYGLDTASAVTDPVFGRDIAYFLFELPFLRSIQSLFNALVVAALVVTLARYLVGATRGSLVFTTPVRVHLAVLGGLFLLSVAFGYQLDKYELAYSTRGIAAGVSFTDQNAQFLAYDVLTILSGLAAALLVGGAFTRMLWPLGLVVGVWLLASIVVGRLYPAAIQRLTVKPNEYAQEQPYIANNIAMTRLAFGIDDWEDRSFRGEDVLTAEAIENEVDTFTNARLWDYRPARRRRSTSSSACGRYYDFYDVDTDRYEIDGSPRQVMLSARELATDQNQGGGRLRQRADRVHPRHRRGHGPGQRGRQRGPAAAVHPEPAAGLVRRRPGADPAADLLRRAAERLGHHRRPPDRVRLPDRLERGRRRTAAPRRAGPARPGSASGRPWTGCCSRCASAT